MNRLTRLLSGHLGVNLRDFDSQEPDDEVPKTPELRKAVPASPSSPLRLELLLKGKIGHDLSEYQVKQRQANSPDRDDTGVVKDQIYLWEPKSLRIRAINWSHVLLAEYLPYLYKGLISAALIMITWQVSIGAFKLSRAVELASDPMLIELVLAAGLIIMYVANMKASVYCLDSALFVPPKEWQVTKEQLITMMQAQDCFTDESIDFLTRVLSTSGTGESTAWPPSMTPCLDGQTPAEISVDVAREEAKCVVFPIVRELLDRTGVQPEDIDFLVINCSLFSPTPSLCALVCNEFRLREDVRTYNLGGMGCSANVIAVDLAKQLLQNQPGSRALVISTENLTQNLYKGNVKKMLLQNTLFRCGGCALMLSSRREDSTQAKYKLLYTFRAQVSEDSSYNCVYQQPDSEGHLGVALSRDIVKVAGRAMKRNFIQLGPYVLPLREQGKVVLNRAHIVAMSMGKKMGLPLFGSLSMPVAYTPCFSKGIEHFCIHAGGRAVIEGVQKNLNLSDEQIKPSMCTLHDFGNTSSSSVWYELEWAERFGNMQRGDRVLQIAFGSGFKCNSAVWVALRVDASKIGKPLKNKD